VSWLESRHHCINPSQQAHLRALAELSIVVVEHQAVPDVFVIVHALYSLLAAIGRNGNGGNPGVNLLLACEVEHSKHLRTVANVRRADVAAVGCEVLSHELGKGLVTEADVVELAHDLEGREVCWQVELVGGICAVEDEVELEGVLLLPVLLAGDGELLGAHLQSILLLSRAVGEHVDLSAKSDSPKYGVVTEATHTDDGNLLARTSTKSDQRAVGGKTGAHHGRCLIGGDVVGDLEGEVLVSTNVRGVAAHSDCTILVRGAVSVNSCAGS
jgi:hypothetical protein